MRGSWSTWGLSVAAVAVAVVAHAERWRDRGLDREPVGAAGRSVFDLHAEELAAAAVRIERRDGRVIALVPSDAGHQVELDGEGLGPADSEALQGLWASLTMATTLRSVHVDLAPALTHGRIAVDSPSGTRAVALGGSTPDGVGVYGALEHGGGALWVVEDELAMAVETEPLGWVARRLSEWRASEVERVEFHGRGSLARGLDGLWRSTWGSSRALLSTAAVDGRLDTMLAATFEPLETRTHELEPWFTVRDQRGHTQSMRVGGACGENGRIVDRGKGVQGCVGNSVLDPWNVPGEEEPRAGTMIEARLLPHGYGRVLSIEQHRPSALVLRRRGGGWTIAGRREDGDRVVDETEVFRWYEQMQAIAVERAPDSMSTDDLRLAWTVHTDSTQSLHLECGTAQGRQWCRRDGGIPLWISSDLDLEELRPEAFTPRRLAEFAVHDVRALEIRELTDGVRQSLHRDLGTWRLDAPRHPVGDMAIDEVAVEALLSQLSALRAEAWSRDERVVPERIVRVEFRPSAGPPLEIEVGADCRVSVPGTPAAVIDTETCRGLGAPLLFRDPLRGALQDATSLEVSRGEDVILRARRQRDSWGADGLARDWLDWAESWRAAALKSGASPSGVQAELRTLSVTGQATTWQLGSGWARVAGEDWYYVQAEPATELPRGS